MSASDQPTNGDRSELPEGWEWKTLKEIADCKLGKMLDKRKNVGEPRPYLRNVNVQWGRIDLGDLKEMRITDAEAERYSVQRGDLLVCEGGEPGRCAVWREDHSIFFQKALHRVRPSGEVSAEYLQYFLTFAVLSGYLDSLLTGTTIKHLPGVRLAKIRVPVPPPGEQQRIVSALEERFSYIDAAAEPLRLARSRLEVFGAAALQEAVAAGNERTVGDLLTHIEAGKSFSCHGHPAPNDAWGVVKVSAMTWGEFREDENKEVFDESQLDRRWEIRPGDLLISRANTSEYVGAAVLVGETRPKLLLSDKSLRLVPNRAEVDPAWLYCALNAPSSRAQMSALATGTSDSMRNLSQDKIKAVRLRVPPRDEQEQVASRIFATLSTGRKLAREVAGQQETAAALRRAILRDAVQGRLGAETRARRR